MTITRGAAVRYGRHASWRGVYRTQHKWSGAAAAGLLVLCVATGDSCHARAHGRETRHDDASPDVDRTPIGTMERPCTLRAVVFPSAVVSPETLDVMQREAARIWSPYRVVLDWARPAAGQRMAHGTLAIEVTRSTQQSQSSPLEGVVLFDTPVRPGPLIRIRIARERVLDAVRVGKRRLDQLPRDVQDRHVGLGLGRVLAHEIGHYVLATRQHSDRGLMRAGFTLPDIAGNYVDSFSLDAASEALLSPAWSMRPACIPSMVAGPTAMER